MKRKNENPTYGGMDVCKDHDKVGVDLNRNYGFAFGTKQMRHGKETYFDEICSPVYAGPHPFSEPETRAIRDFVFGHLSQLKFVYNFHGFGNMYLYPMNALKGVNRLGDLYPQFKDLFAEITDHSAPEGDRIGNAY